MIIDSLKKLFARQEHFLVANTLFRTLWSTLWYGLVGIGLVTMACLCFSALFFEGGFLQKILGLLIGITCLGIGGVLLKIQGYEFFSSLYLRLFGQRTRGSLTHIKHESKTTPKGTNLSKYHLGFSYKVWNEKQKVETLQQNVWVWENHFFADEFAKGKQVAILFNPRKPLQALVQWKPADNVQYIDLSLPEDSEF